MKPLILFASFLGIAFLLASCTPQQESDSQKGCEEHKGLHREIPSNAMSLGRTTPTD